MRSHKLSKLLTTIDEHVNGHKNVTMAHVLGALERRGFGPLLVVPSILTILPTGAIPGVPALCGALICLISCQIIVGREKPWVPKRIRNMKVSRKKLTHAIEKAMPLAEAIDDFAHPRYEALTKDVWQRVIAGVCIILAAMMALIGFIPYVPALLAFPVLLFAIGLSVRDGLLTFISFLLTIIVLGSLPFVFTLIK
jgi:hypothetical protein